jgi:glucose-1-phosphate thymidylyltransferase
LIPVGGKPISQYCLEDMKSAGITEVAVILGNLWPEKVVEYYGDGTKLGMKLTYINQGVPRGLAQALSLAESFVNKDKVVMYLGDNLLKMGITTHAKAFETGNADGMVLLSKVEDPQRFGVARFDSEGKLVGLVEKPKQPPSPYALVGVYFFTSMIFEAIRQLKPSSRGEYEITDAIQTLLMSGGRVAHSFVEGWWKDTGTVNDILVSNSLVLDDKMQTALLGTVEIGASIEGRVHVDDGAVVCEGSTVKGPAYVGSRSIIGPNAYVGPYTSIGADCRVLNSEIENSVVLDGVEILDVGKRITGSIIGAHSKIVGATERPAGYKLIIGEQSSVKV